VANVVVEEDDVGDGAVVEDPVVVDAVAVVEAMAVVDAVAVVEAMAALEALGLDGYVPFVAGDVAIDPRFEVLVQPMLDPDNPAYDGPGIIDPRYCVTPGDFRFLDAREGVRQGVRDAWVRLNDRAWLWFQLRQIDLDADNDTIDREVVAIMSVIYPSWEVATPHRQFIQQHIKNIIFSLSISTWEQFISAREYDPVLLSMDRMSYAEYRALYNL
jgi:hypothetical protein